MSLGKRLALLRRKSGESLQVVADAVGVSKAHIWELEKARAENPSMDLVARLADHFGTSVSYLVGEDIDARDADRELQSMFRQARKLSTYERQILGEMLQTLLKHRGQRAQT